MMIIRVIDHTTMMINVGEKKVYRKWQIEATLVEMNGCYEAH